MVNGAPDVFPHYKEHRRDEDVVLNVEGEEIVETAGEHGANAGGAVAHRFMVFCKNNKDTTKFTVENKKKL